MLDDIMRSIYWVSFTKKQQENIIAIVSNPDYDNISKGNDICDYLGIERRGNRQAIAQVLNKQGEM